MQDSCALQMVQHAIPAFFDHFIDEATQHFGSIAH